MSLWPAKNKMSRKVGLHDNRIATGLLFVVALLSLPLPLIFAGVFVSSGLNNKYNNMS